jgi:hypothetical protein
MVKSPAIIATEINGIYAKNESISILHGIAIHRFSKVHIGRDEIALTKIKDLPLFCQP